jgi:hypothetical protein
MQLDNDKYVDEMTKYIPKQEEVKYEYFDDGVLQSPPPDYRLLIAIGCMIVGAIILVLEGCK